MWAYIKSEPAMLLGFIQALAALGMAFGLKLSAEQVAAVMAASTAGLGLLVRQAVTPVSGSK